MVSRMNRRARTALLAGLGLTGLAATGLLTHRHVPDIVGPAQVIDGDSIRVAGIEIRNSMNFCPQQGVPDDYRRFAFGCLLPASGAGSLEFDNEGAWQCAKNPEKP